MTPVGREAEAAARVRAAIDAACARAGRDPGSVTLVAATKTVAADRIAGAGVADVGENRVQEMLEKQEALANVPLQWHFIGALQRNKARKIAGRVVLVHGVGSLEVARALDRAAADAGVNQPILLEVNVAGDPSKAGVAPAELGTVVEGVRALGSVSLRGLMTIPPAGSGDEARLVFRRLAALAAEHGLPELSMGMSDDFEVAVEEGATLVRVGSAIFGHRPAS